MSREISDKNFSTLTTYLFDKYGLYFKPEKRTMLQSRFAKRLNALQLNTFDKYMNFVFSSKGKEEYSHFVDLVTTHKTSFFREDYQFKFLKTLLDTPQYISKRQFKVWSAGCSTGEEVYTLGVLLQEKRNENPGFDYKILGTDISTPSLKKAAKGTYTANEIHDMPALLKDKYFFKKAESYQFSNKEIQSKIKLGTLNLNNSIYNINEQFDVVFCRNVIIYFDAVTQRKVLEKLISKIKPGGYLFLGHSETAIGSTLPIKSIKPTIYQKL